MLLTIWRSLAPSCALKQTVELDLAADRVMEGNKASLVPAPESDTVTVGAIFVKRRHVGDNKLGCSQAPSYHPRTQLVFALDQ